MRTNGIFLSLWSFISTTYFNLCSDRRRNSWSHITKVWNLIFLTFFSPTLSIYRCKIHKINNHLHFRPHNLLRAMQSNLISQFPSHRKLTQCNAENPYLNFMCVIKAFTWAMIFLISYMISPGMATFVNIRSPQCFPSLTISLKQVKRKNQILRRNAMHLLYHTVNTIRLWRSWTRKPFLQSFSSFKVTACQIQLQKKWPFIHQNSTFVSMTERYKLSTNRFLCSLHHLIFHKGVQLCGIYRLVN